MIIGQSPIGAAGLGQWWTTVLVTPFTCPADRLIWSLFDDRCQAATAPDRCALVPYTERFAP